MKKKFFDAGGWKSYSNTKKCCIVELGVLALGAGRVGAGRAGRARGACVLGVQGARGRRACVGRAGVARRACRRHGRWAARAQARGALELAGARHQARHQAGRAFVGAQTGAGAGRCANTGGHAGRRGARGRRTLGRRAGRARQGARAAGARQGARTAGSGARGVRSRGGRRTAWALGAQPGLGLCTRCTRPVFGPVRLGIFLSQNFWTLFVNPVHEHRSSRNFSKKKKN